MKILFLVNDLSGEHGWSTYTRNIISEAVTEGFEVFAAVAQGGASIPQVIGFPILSLPHAIIWNPISILKNYLRVRKLIENIRPDIVHIVAEPYAQLCAFGLFPCPVVLSLHGTYSRLPLTVKRPIQRFIARLLYMRALNHVTRCISVSERTKRLFIAYAGPVAPPTTIIHNSIQIPPEATPVTLKKPYHVVMVGAVKVRKGLHEAIPLLAKWAEAHRTKILYDVVGLFDSTVEYCAQVKCLAEKYKSEFFAVVFHGHVDVETKKELIKEAVCYLHLERVTDDDVEVEGFGISIIEAASYGVPAIVAHGSATAEAVSDGKSGYMINLQNQDDFDQALTRVIEKKSLTKPEILAWADIHSTSNIFKQIDSIYKSL